MSDDIYRGLIELADKIEAIEGEQEKQGVALRTALEPFEKFADTAAALEEGLLRTGDEQVKLVQAEGERITTRVADLEAATRANAGEIQGSLVQLRALLQQERTQLEAAKSDSEQVRAELSATKERLERVDAAIAEVGTELAARVNLNPCGRWMSGTYHRGDLVFDAGSSYLCLETTDEKPSRRSRRWMLMAARGAGGGGGSGGESTPGSGTGDMLRANNLSDLTNVSTARVNLGLGGAAVLNVGTSAGTVAAGDHTHAGVYALATHTHAIADTTGLQTALDAKAPLASPTFTGVITASGAQVSPGTAVSGNVVNTALRNNTISLSADVSLNFSGPPTSKTTFGLEISCDATARTVTIPSSFSAARGGAITSFTVPANWRGQVFWYYTGSEYIVLGEPLTQEQWASAVSLDDDATMAATSASRAPSTRAMTLWVASQIDGLGSGTGDVTAASNFGTDNRIIRSDGTTKGLQSSEVEIDDVGTISLMGEQAGSWAFGDGHATAPKYAVLSAPATISADYTLILPTAVGSKDQALVISSLTGTTAQLGFASMSGSGTVTKVSVTTANGVSGTVANDTTTPAITLSLGAITPTSVNGVTLSGSSTPTLAVTGTSAISGTNTGDQTTITGNAGTATKLETARTINGVSFDGTANITVTAAGSTLSDTVPVGKGGTGLTSGTSGGIPFFSSTSAMTSSAALTDNGIVIGGGAGATPETVAGLATNGISQLQLGVAGTSVGSVQLRNATSGSITIQPTTGALGTVTITAPATTGTLYVTGGTDVSVADGGTGRSTSTTAYGLIAAGTTATGALQTLATGATTDILVSGGSSALPVWTTATGSGAPVRATSPTLVTPILGTPTSGTLTNCTGLPVATGISGLGTGVATALAVNTGSAGAVVTFNGALGTPSSGTLTSCTIKAEIGIACSDETTALTTGTAKVTFRMPYAMTLTAVRATVTTAPTGSTLVVDINEGGTSILGTKLSIDATEKTSTTAASAATITDSALADDAEITVDIDQVGSTVAGAGLKVWLIGTRS